MARFLNLVGGVPRGVNTADNIYQDEIIAPSGGYTINTTLTLPNGGTYDSTDLKLFKNGVLLTESLDYSYVGTPDPNREQVELLDAADEGDVFLFRVTGDPLTIYDAEITIGVGGATSGDLFTLPSSRTYFDAELQVYLNGVFLRVTQDYDYVGASPPRTQIETLQALDEGDVLRFRIDQ